MNEITANAFRQGYSLRTFANMNMFPYREDNVGRALKSFLFSTEAEGVTFNINFNVNEIDFNSRLNEHV
jgi:hypothetical protein